LGGAALVLEGEEGGFGVVVVVIIIVAEGVGPVVVVAAAGSGVFGLEAGRAADDAAFDGAVRGRGGGGR
jgi:hypothetical protein